MRWISYKDYISEGNTSNSHVTYKLVIKTGLTRHFVKHLLSDCNQREISNLSSQVSEQKWVWLFNDI